MSYTFPRRNAGSAPLAPAAFSELAARYPTHGACKSLATAGGGLAQCYQQVLEGHQRIVADKTLTPAAALVRSAKFARTKLDVAFIEIRRAQDAAADIRRDLTEKINAPFRMDNGRPYAEVLLYQEIRAHFNKLTQTQRIAAIQTAIESNDERTLLAIGSVPAVLSGTIQPMWEAARQKVIETHAAGEAEALAELDEAESVGATIEHAMLQSVADLIDFETAAAFERGASEAA